ncbi:unnamed protein product [Paramecium primaurelia]|uniref:Transmembrane protein n=1 Tax=Paramecium primaurelia TaxID=5886 RepID=A0A8S1PIX0_PARPR|nr:unnamed protein product [Paramecium primaurelia]
MSYKRYQLIIMAKEQMHVYEMSSTNKKYSKINEITVKIGYNGCYYYFPQQYIRLKYLVVNKNGYNVNLIRNQNGDFITQQSIDFGHYNIFGFMSEDGEYLMTWEENQRKFKQENIIRYEEELNIIKKINIIYLFIILYVINDKILLFGLLKVEGYIDKCQRAKISIILKQIINFYDIQNFIFIIQYQLCNHCKKLSLRLRNFRGRKVQDQNDLNQI